MHTDISYSSEKKENILKMTQEQVIHALQHYAPSHYQMRLIKPWERQLQQEESAAMHDRSRAPATALWSGISDSAPASIFTVDLRRRGAATGDLVAGNGLAIRDLDRSAADLAAAAAERQKDAIVWSDRKSVV